MKVTPDPASPDITLGAPIRPAAPPPPELHKPFEAGNHGADGKLIADTSIALDTMVEALGKPSSLSAEELLGIRDAREIFASTNRVVADLLGY